MKNFTLFNKKLILFISFIGITFFGFGQTTLTAGDIVITGFNSDNPDEFTFVLLTDVLATTQIKFTDNGWQTSGGFRPGEGVLIWTATTDISCGTEITIYDNNNPFVASIGTITDHNNFAFAANGDQILAYQGADASPTFIYAIHFASAIGWSDATTPQTTALPIGLSDGANAVYVGNFDNGNYNCAVTTDSASILASVSTSTQWNGNNTRIATLGGCGFNCSACSSTATWDGVAWTPVTGPDATTEVILNANYDTATDLPGSFNACSLTVNAGFILNIQGTDYVKVENDVNIDGTITIANEASLVQVNDLASVTLNGLGDGVLQKTTTVLTAWYDYTYWSSPVSNETIGSVFGLVPSHRIYEYNAANFEDTDANGFDDDANDWSIASGVMTPGKGYAAVAENNGFGYPQNNTMVFNGQFNNGVITPPVTMSPGPNPLNWNFLGNPYPSPIDADLFLTNPANATNLGGSLYFWVHNLPPDGANPGNEGQNFSVDDYATYNMSGGTSAAVSGGVVPSGIIATGQGFFVEALSAGTAIFNNSMRVETGNTNFYKTSDRIWLNFKNDYGAFSQILIGFNENATDGFDRLYDGKRLDASSYVSFFSFIDDEKYAIQSKSSIKEEESIPIGIMTTIEEEMEYSISIDNVEGILESSEVYLIDNDLGIEHNLNESAYSFNTLNGEFKDRFVLSLKTDSRLINPTLENELIISTNEVGQDINFSTTQLSNITNVQIYDMLGRLLHNVDFSDETTTARITSNSLKNSIFIVKATLSDGKMLTKKVIL